MLRTIGTQIVLLHLWSQIVYTFWSCLQRCLLLIIDSDSMKAKAIVMALLKYRCLLSTPRNSVPDKHLQPAAWGMDNVGWSDWEVWLWYDQYDHGMTMLWLDYDVDGVKEECGRELSGLVSGAVLTWTKSQGLLLGTLDSGSTRDVLYILSMYHIYTQAEMSSCVWIVHVISANCWACAALAARAKNWGGAAAAAGGRALLLANEVPRYGHTQQSPVTSR